MIKGQYQVISKLMIISRQQNTNVPWQAINHLQMGKKKKNYLKNPIKFKKTGRTELKVRKGVIRLSLIYTTGGMYFF